MNNQLDLTILSQLATQEAKIALEVLGVPIVPEVISSFYELANIEHSTFYCVHNDSLGFLSMLILEYDE